MIYSERESDIEELLLKLPLPMGFRGFWGVFMFFLIVFYGILVGFAKQNVHSEKYISWDDFTVAKTERTSSAYEHNQSRMIVVDKHGRGDSVTVQGAVDMVPHQNTKRVKIHIRPGIYKEKVLVPRNKPYISFIGDENQASNTVISWNNKASDKDEDGNSLGTYRSASVSIESDYFCATGITFQNTIKIEPKGVGRQAVALRVAGDKAMFYKVRIVGDQDTLLDESGSHYFSNCEIQGSVDFIFGRSKSLFERCILRSTAKNYGSIAAHHRDSSDEDTGFSFVRCSINGTGNVLLGRAWGNYSRAIYSYCSMADIINPLGWSDWKHPSRQRTAVFGEYKCRGKGADTRRRVYWSKSFNEQEAEPFLNLKFINGHKWLKLNRDNEPYLP